MKKQNTAKAEAEEQLFESLYSADYDADGEYREIEIKHLDSFDYFPFHVYTEQQLELMAASIVRNGVITPIIVRPRKDGTSYQIISGHHRVDACRRLEMPTVPCIIRELSDQDAMLCYIDSNLRQRKDLTPSEKAEAYKLMQKAWDEKKASGAPMEHRKIRDLIGKECGDSGAQVQRYLRLNYLIEPLQKKVDNGTISMRAGVELSYLTKAEQETLRTAVLKEQIAPTEKQAKKIRALSEQKRCTLQNIRTVLCTKDADFESAAKPELPEAEIIPLKPQEESVTTDLPGQNESIASEEAESEPEETEHSNKENDKPAAETEVSEEDLDEDVPEEHQPAVSKAPERTIHLRWAALSRFFAEEMSDEEIADAIMSLLERYGSRSISDVS